MRNYESKKVKVGRLGTVEFKPGFYFYVGSSDIGIHRIKRHFRKNKRKRWHIDYITDKFEILGAIMLKQKECELALRLSRNLEYVPKFGCSDCKCPSHLFYSKSLTLDFLPI
ncbi:endonuclease III [Archaeoglobales archaeon ex4484_92]|nr:MAG: endonuclease III [Archaeoglobales archaeon ex4484_92]